MTSKAFEPSTCVLTLHPHIPSGKAIHFVVQVGKNLVI